MLARAAREVRPGPCTDADPIPSRRLSRAERAQVMGEVVALPDGRMAALVRVATGRGDANGELAYGYVWVVLAREGAGWRADATSAVDVSDAPHQYEGEPALVEVRLEDVDDDGEVELLSVMSTSTTLECGTGYCTARRTVVVGVSDPDAPVMANVVSSLECQTEGRASHEGTVRLRDVNADGHRDVVLRARYCPDTEQDAEGNAVQGPCRRRERVFVWDAATDRYLTPQ